MKAALIAAVSLAALTPLAPAMAQDQAAPIKGPYVNLGYGRTHASGVDLDGIGARLGYRFNNWIGVEGEGAFGVGSDHVTVGGVRSKVDLKHQLAGYVVGFAPLSPKTDLLARVGYGTTKIGAAAGGFRASGSEESWNWGVGAQHHFDGVNGVRVDFTRESFNHDAGHANVWSAAYTRRF